MNCPKCRKTVPFTRVDLAEGLTALECQICRGNWLPRETYGRWLQKQGGTLPEKEVEETGDLPGPAPEQALICPDCDHILIKAKVGRGLNFRLDRCFHCGGIWLDANEWESLEGRNLHDEIHFIYTQVWQRRSREGE